MTFQPSPMFVARSKEHRKVASLGLALALLSDWEGMAGTNTLVYWANSYVTNKIKCGEYDPGSVFTTLHILRNLLIGPIS
jgi:hypothetical protein